MRKTTFLTALFCTLIGGSAMADNVRYNGANGGLPGEAIDGNTRYQWTSPQITAPEGFTTLRLTFVDNKDHSTSQSDYPFVCISEFYLYDKSNNPVTLTVDNFSTNAQQAGEGPMENICDGNTENTNYWHSRWNGSVGAYHYLEVTMPDGEYDLSQFAFGWIGRNEASAPIDILVTTGTSHDDVDTQAAPRRITYQYIHNGEIWYTDSKTALYGSTYPDPTSVYGVNAAAQEGIVTVNTTKEVQCTIADTYPFQFASSYTEAEHWYKLGIHTSKYLLRYNENDTQIPLSATTVPAGEENAYTWTFVGNPYTGFQIYNLSAGGKKVLSSSTTMSGVTGSGTTPILTPLPVPEGNNTHWDVTAGHFENGFYLNQHGRSGNKMNKRDNVLAFWTGGADDGSTFSAEEVDMNDYSFLFWNAADEITAPLDILKYASAICPAEALAAQKQTIKQQLETILNGKTTKAEVLTAIETLQANTEIPAAISTAMTTLLDDQYFTLNNKNVSGQYLTAANGYSTVNTTLDMTSCWTLKVVGTKFKLYNKELNVYMGSIPNANETKVPVVTNENEAGLYMLMSPTYTDNVLAFVQDNSNGQDSWGLHKAGDNTRIVRWYVKALATQWTMEFIDINSPYIQALLTNGYQMIYHTDNNGVKHYMQIAPDGTLSLTETPVYSFNLTAANQEGYANNAFYLTMNGHRLSHWNGTTFNTNEIATNDVHCEGVWHCQAIFYDTAAGRYAIRSTNATGANANTYMVYDAENGTFASVASDNYQNADLYQWEIRSGYPFDLTTDDSNPSAYGIKTGRTNNDLEWWYTYNTNDKIVLNQFTNTDKMQYWYFKEIEEDGTCYLQLYPYAGEGKAISYNDMSNGTDKVSGQTIGTEGYNNKWLLATTNGYEPYGLQTSGKETYLSNHSGVTHIMGFLTSGPSADPGTAMYFTPFTTPTEDFWSEYIGTELGKYNVSEPDLTNATTITSYYQAVDAFFASLDNNIVQPTDGFYRLKGSVSGNYIDASGTITESGNVKMLMKPENERNNAASIFYLSTNGNNKLLNYGTGTYLMGTYNVEAIGAEAGDNVTFKSSEKKDYGYYTIKTNSGSPYLYDNTTRADRNSTYNANGRCDWIIEPVTELPVTIGNARWTTFCSPMNLMIPADVKVYYASTEEEREGVVVVKPVTSDILPAGLPVMITAAPGSYNFTITTDEQSKPTQVNETLKGTEAGKINAATDGSTYVLTVLKSTGNVGFAKNKSGAVPGFKAYLEPSNSNAESFSISFSDNVTGIQSVAREDDKATEYYDLSGRRVYFPTKGIYVTGRGEKVLIK